jgi:hypothetical protein
MKLTPEQIDQQKRLYMLSGLNPKTIGDFDIWLAAIESQPEKEIELPEKFKYSKEYGAADAGYVHGFNEGVDAVESIIKKAGFKVKVKE